MLLRARHFVCEKEQYIFFFKKVFPVTKKQQMFKEMCLIYVTEFSSYYTSCWRQLTSSVKNTTRCTLENFSNKKITYECRKRESSWENFVQRGYIKHSTKIFPNLVSRDFAAIFALLFCSEQLRYSWEILIVSCYSLIFFSRHFFSSLTRPNISIRKKRHERGKTP